MTELTPVMKEQDNLTKGEREFVIAVAYRLLQSFHKRIIERCELKGLVRFCGGMRLVGRNSFPATYFHLTQRGLETVIGSRAAINRKPGAG